ncbi:MAG: V-type ATPase 116kDa subunit family protein [Solirubrobacteraceae bacterium]
MARVALVAPLPRLRAMLVVLADAGSVQLVGPVLAPQGEAAEALRRLQRSRAQDLATGPRLVEQAVDLRQLETAGREDLLAGEVELDRRAQASLRHAGFGVLVGWVPKDELAALSERLAAIGATTVELPRPGLVEPPTLLRRQGLAGRFGGLVQTYGAARYADIDPTPFAALSFVVMFGMMFGDVGHGLVLTALGLLLRRSHSPRLRGLRALWPFAVFGGLAAACFGLLYGEAFGPTAIVPTLWRRPLDQPVELLTAGVAVGALLLASSYALGVLNRWRESGLVGALLAPSGIAGLTVFGGIALLGLGVLAHVPALSLTGALIAGGGVVLLLAGFLAEAGTSGAAVAQALIEVLDAVMRVGANLISFTRLAAFGLMHAALGSVVLSGAHSLWLGGVPGKAAAAILFALGNAAAFSLEALVAGVQAMRLEYYELFSRIFAGEGEPFAPWRIPVVGLRHPA